MSVLKLSRLALQPGLSIKYEYIDTHDVHKALIVGAGYISLEVLENLYQRGLDTIDISDFFI
jgi:NADPH-dependent 2,4-dienoyl-CoA reductase/sulfur reductase-like enzyme